MTSKEALNELFNEANKLSHEEPKCTTHDLWEMCKQIQNDLEILEKINSKCFLLFSGRKKLAKEYEDWCIKNNVLITDTTNMVTWFLCIKLKEWLENDK